MSSTLRRAAAWWAAACSIYATMLSSLTYVALPALVFAFADGPRLVMAAERNAAEARAERVERGHRARGASPQA